MLFICARHVLHLCQARYPFELVLLLHCLLFLKAYLPSLYSFVHHTWLPFNLYVFIAKSRTGNGKISACGGNGYAGGGGGRVSVNVFSRHDEPTIYVHGEIFCEGLSFLVHLMVDLGHFCITRKSVTLQ